MRKAWRVVSTIALACLVLGVLGIAVGFFTGSSPTVIQSHGSLTEYMQRLETNWEVLRGLLTELLDNMGL
ncbi:MAG: hypothetical protein LUE22_03725 [Oscillospiraceae bacterium]|nr:hypothetical protein [Oscillospiraceae bacterium]